MSLNISREFRTSYVDAAEYPTNTCDSNTYTPTLDAYKDRLQEAAPTLCVRDEKQIHVPFRDLVPTAQDPNILEFRKQNIFSRTALNKWIGDKSMVVNNTLTGDLVTLPDPLTRFIFLYAESSLSELKLTIDMLLQILSYHQVMPSFLEFALLFGLQTRPVDLRYSGFREETCLTAPSPGLDMPDLRRSGKHFELCYNLKAVNRKGPGEWSIRHAAVYHKFDVLFGTSLWLVVKGSLDLKNKIEPMTGKQCKDQDRQFKSVEGRFGSTLAVHLLVAHWAGESWRWYLQYLEEQIETETKDARYQDREKTLKPKLFTSRDLQNIQIYTEKANETVTVIESNVEVLMAMRAYYEQLLLNPDFTIAAGVHDHISRLSRQLNNIVYDLKMQSARAKLLAQEIQSRKDLILQHLQSQNTQSMELLTMATYDITKVAQRDAIAIRIITVVTLFYLPATFVSSFFSTDVVKYQDPNSSPPNSSTSFSGLAMARWLQVTLPLTAFTLIIAYFGYLWARTSVKKNETYERVQIDEDDIELASMSK